MQYLLLLTADPEAPVEEAAREDASQDWVAITRALRDAGVLRGGEALHPGDTATTVRVRGRDRLLTDGPFTETKELLIGFYLIEVDDLDAALGWAARMPNAAWGSVEVRPVAVGPASGAPS